MTLKDVNNSLLVENMSNIFQNNLIKVQMVKDQLKQIFDDDNTPDIDFDENGLYIKITNFQARNLENISLKSFVLQPMGFDSDDDKILNIKKFYIQYIKIEKPPVLEPEEKN